MTIFQSIILGIVQGIPNFFDIQFRTPGSGSLLAGLEYSDISGYCV